MAVKVVDQVHDSLLGEAWQLYYDAFRELNAFAVQRHLMYRNEFDDVMRDKRIHKYLWMDGDIGGVATYTNDLDAVPLISPQYFERRWPDLYAQRRVWYCGFVAVAPALQGRGKQHVFADLVGAMYAATAVAGGIIMVDMCRFNDQTRRLSAVIPLLLRRFAGEVHTERADEQSYWLYEFPRATGPAPDDGEEIAA